MLVTGSDEHSTLESLQKTQGEPGLPRCGDRPRSRWLIADQSRRLCAQRDVHAVREKSLHTIRRGEYGSPGV